MVQDAQGKQSCCFDILSRTNRKHLKRIFGSPQPLRRSNISKPEPGDSTLWTEQIGADRGVHHYPPRSRWSPPSIRSFENSYRYCIASTWCRISCALRLCSTIKVLCCNQWLISGLNLWTAQRQGCNVSLPFPDELNAIIGPSQSVLHLT